MLLVIKVSSRLIKSSTVVINSEGDGNNVVKRIAEQKIIRQIINVISNIGKKMVNGCFRLTSNNSSPLSVRNLSQLPCVIIDFSSVSITVPPFFL